MKPVKALAAIGLGGAWSACATDTSVAPVVRFEGDSVVNNDTIVMIQTAWFKYDKKDGVVLLYCMENTDPATLSCTMYVTADDANAVVVLTNVDKNPERYRTK